MQVLKLFLLFICSIIIPFICKHTRSGIAAEAGIQIETASVL